MIKKITIASVLTILSSNAFSQEHHEDFECEPYSLNVIGYERNEITTNVTVKGCKNYEPSIVSSRENHTYFKYIDPRSEENKLDIETDTINVGKSFKFYFSKVNVLTYYISISELLEIKKITTIRDKVMSAPLISELNFEGNLKVSPNIIYPILETGDIKYTIEIVK